MIDEKKLIEELDKLEKGVFYMPALFYEMIARQPQADKWIPCEERLPKEHDNYIVTYEEIRGGKVRYYTSEAWFRPQTREWYGNISIPNLEREVIAWQEKLKPYERMTEREGKCKFEQPFPRGDAYICKKTALICTAEKLKFCKYKEPYKKEGAE